MVLIAIIGAALLAAAPAAPDLGNTERAEQEKRYVEARQLARSGKSEEALRKLRDLRARIETGFAGEKRMIFSGQTPTMTLMNMFAAGAIKRDAVDVGPIYGQTIFLEGFVLVDLGKLGEARTELDRAVAVSPNNPQFLCEDAHTHARDHDSAGALGLYRRCEGAAGMADKENEARWQAAGLRGQGFALTELNRLDEAAAAYQRSLAIEPGNSVALGELQYIQNVRSGMTPQPSQSITSGK